MPFFVADRGGAGEEVGGGGVVIYSTQHARSSHKIQKRKVEFSVIGKGIVNELGWRSFVSMRVVASVGKFSV